MPEAPNHAPSPAGAPEVPPPVPLSRKEMDRLPIIEVVRHRVLERPGAGRFIRQTIEHALGSEEVPAPMQSERRGKVTGRTHDQVVADTLDVRQRRIRRRSRTIGTIGLRAL